jgi:hypothetical protein
MYDKLKPEKKSDEALNPDGTRTVWGYYDSGDASVLARHYPNVGAGMIADIAALIHHPRLLEVAGVVEMVERFLEGAFSTIRGAGVALAANPLSILFWSDKHGVRRIKTHETELLHGPMEKLALRVGSLRAINQLLNRRYGMQLTFGCSYCAITVKTDDLEALYASSYYQEREGFGRQFDSDVLSVSGNLFGGISVADIPPQILAATADFHQAEVASYLRFAKAMGEALVQNPMVPTHNEQTAAVRDFLSGSSFTPIAAE